MDVAIHLEEAMNSYIKGDNIWGDCITDFSCSTNSIDPQLQEHWADAASNIDDAKRGLKEMAEPEGSGAEL